VPEDEFVEVDLELGLAHAVVCANEPLLEVADGSIGKSHRGLCAFSQFQTERLDAGDVFKTGLDQARETLEAVGVDCRARCNIRVLSASLYEICRS